MTRENIIKLYEATFNRKCNLDLSETYFKSPLHEIAFYFSINNAKFDTKLGIVHIHKIDKNKANELKNFYFNIFNDGNKSSDLNYNVIRKDIEKTFHRVTAGLAA